MNEVEVVRKGIELGVKNGIYLMQDVVLLSNSLDALAKAVAPTEVAEPAATKDTAKTVTVNKAK